MGPFSVGPRVRVDLCEALIPPFENAAPRSLGSRYSSARYTLPGGEDLGPLNRLLEPRPPNAPKTRNPSPRY